MAQFYRSNLIVFAVIVTVFCRLTMGSTGNSNPSPINPSKPRDGHNVTSIIVQHGQSFKAECRQLDESAKSPDRIPLPSRHRRDEPSDDDFFPDTFDINANSSLEFHNEETALKQTVHVLTAKYMPAAKATQSCGILDAGDIVKPKCSDVADTACLFVASDPSTVIGCQRRSLQVEYYCGDAESVGSMMVGGMLDDTD